jgi:hypothetical protein
MTGRQAGGTCYFFLSKISPCNTRGVVGFEFSRRIEGKNDAWQLIVLSS